MTTTTEERQIVRDVRDRLTGNNIVRTQSYPSSSSNRMYEVITRANGSKSCNCPAWTRRVQPDGSRNCKHIDWAKAGI